MKGLAILLTLFPLYGLSSLSPINQGSVLQNKYQNFYQHKQSFKLHTNNTKWRFENPKTNKNSESIIASYIPANDIESKTFLTLRYDILKKNLKLKTYVKSWIKDYERFGFQVLQHKPIIINQNKAYLVDLYHQPNKTKLRQVIYLKKQESAILTCKSTESNFELYFKECNQIFKNFSWL